MTMNQGILTAVYTSLGMKNVDIGHVAHDVRALHRDARQTMFNLAAGNPIHADDLHALLQRATDLNLVNRVGMECSGMKYLAREQVFLKDNAVVPMKDAADVVNHIVVHARRAENIINNPHGYTEGLKRLYGHCSVKPTNWMPLFK